MGFCRLYVVLLCLLSWVSPASAQGTPEQCATIVATSERLACYDGLFGAPASTAPTELSAVIESEQLIPARPTGRGRATLTVACRGGVLSVLFSFAGQRVAEPGGGGSITFLVDEQAPNIRLLAPSEDLLSLGYFDTGDAGEFLTSLAGANRLRVRFTPQNQRSLSVSFRLTDLEAQVAPVREACGV